MYVLGGGYPLVSNGFTLIELLAVIIILGIIALIATPIILGIISDAKDEANMRSVTNILHATELYQNEAELSDDTSFEEDIYDVILNRINGQKPETGNIYINKKGDISFALKYGKYCYTKKYKSEEIKSTTSDTCEVPLDYLMVNANVTSADTTFLGGSINRSEIESITTLDDIIIPEGATSWDVSASQNGSIMAWYVDSDSNGLYELYIGQDGGVIANPDSNRLFKYFSNVKTIDLSNFDTTKVTNMLGMFANLNLTELNLSNFDTSNVTTMSFMFVDCVSLTSLDLSSFDTTKVTTMFGMFQNCKSLTTLDLSNFDTSKVTSTQYMFTGCNNLTSLDVSNFNIDKLKNMSHMFQNCSSLKELDVSKWNTSSVKYMGSMFQGCSSLTKLDVSKWDTSNVIEMGALFSGCSSLTSLDVSKWDTSNATGMGGMFMNCSSLKSLDVNNFNTSKVTNLSRTFDGCKNLTSLDISNFDTSSVTNMWRLFAGCESLKTLNLGAFDLSSVTQTNAMFAITNISNIDIKTTNSTTKEKIESICSNCKVTLSTN